jgi:hypothetical protein
LMDMVLDSCNGGWSECRDGAAVSSGPERMVSLVSGVRASPTRVAAAGCRLAAGALEDASLSSAGRANSREPTQCGHVERAPFTLEAGGACLGADADLAWAGAAGCFGEAAAAAYVGGCMLPASAGIMVVPSRIGTVAWFAGWPEPPRCCCCCCCWS